MLDLILSNFHFLRPQWLWALVPTLAFYVTLSRRLDPNRQWGRLIAPHLLTHLRVEAADRFRIRPMHLTTLAMVLGALAVAGPTWTREISPFAEDTAPLVIVLDVSQSMNAVDVQPTRLERAKQKVRDLLELRPGARTALVAYAGSAHTVLPLSDDPTMFEVFLDGIDTDVMPRSGDEPGEALAIAEAILSRDSVPGSILFITDGIGVEHTAEFVRHERESSDEVMVLAIGTSGGGPIRVGTNRFATDAQGVRIVATLDREGLDALVDAAGVFVAGSTVDDADVSRLQRQVQSHLRIVQQDDPTARWKDNGYYLVFPILLMGLLWFRKGWTVRWGAAVLVFGLSGCTAPQGGSSFAFMDLWLTADQQGRRSYEAGRYAEAGDRFADFMWRGTSRYRAGDMDGAVLAWARVDSPEAHFGLGNAYARLGSLEASIASYERALELRPGWTDAEENRELVQSLIPPPAEEGEEEAGEAGPPNMDPDEVQFDEQGEQGERGEVSMDLMSDEQIAEMWMRRLQTSPGDFLRRRFAIENQRRAGPPSGGGL